MKTNLNFILTFLCLFFFSLFACFAQNQTELWGMTKDYGNESNTVIGDGVIFKTDRNGNNKEKMHSFCSTQGSCPAYGLCIATNGKFYGMTRYGGLLNFGVLFEYEPISNNYVSKIEFNADSGKYPFGSLIQASNGKLYGMTSEGGVYNMGVIFEYDPVTNHYIKNYDFKGSDDGKYPFGSLVQAPNGKLYGMTYEGGINDSGILFEYDPDYDTLIKKLDFNGSLNGGGPKGTITQHSNGKLYGLTSKGGINDMGVLFEYDPITNTYTKKHDFLGNLNGCNPLGSLIQGSDGNLYGMTEKGGENDDGVLFEYNPSLNEYSEKFNFTSIGGSNPSGSLVQTPDGKLYGMTSSGGRLDFGILFEYNPTNDTIVKMYDFGKDANGRSPYGSLIVESNGRLYGMTPLGGRSNKGVLFEYDPATNIVNNLLDFPGFNMGSTPLGSLMQASNGKLYGTTSDGGIAKQIDNSYGGGILFEYDPVSNIFSKIRDFLEFTDGRHPHGTLIQANDGGLYGMTSAGGKYGEGTIFKYDISTNTYSKISDFSGGTNGGHPQGALTQANDGKLYGLTETGGQFGKGVLFKYDLVKDTLIKIIDFEGSLNGSNPFSTLLQASNGKLYGMTYDGGTNDCGVIFEYDPVSDNFTKKHDFKGPNGAYPTGSLIQTSNGKLYGMTNFGGGYEEPVEWRGAGLIFEYDLVIDTFIVKYKFYPTNTFYGTYPSGSLMLASNGKLYGMTSRGGWNDGGILFEYEPDSNFFTRKIDFSQSFGQNPHFTHLIEIWVQPQILVNAKDTTICSGSDGSFSVDARGYDLSYKWQVDKGLGFADIIDDSICVNVTSVTLNIIKAQSGMNGYRFRCEVTSTSPQVTIISDTAILYIKTLPENAATISGLITVCQGQNSITYATPVIEGSASYIWDLPLGATGNSTTDSIMVNYTKSAVSGYITVKGSNLCGVGGQSTLPISVKIKPETPIITLQENILHSNANVGNQWYNQNGMITGATGQEYLVSSDGTYYDIITADECRSDTSNIIQFSLMSIGNINGNKLIKVYPNPTDTELIIEIEGNTNSSKFEILNSVGQIILKGSFVEKIVIPTNDFHPGIYIVKIENIQNHCIIKIAINH